MRLWMLGLFVVLFFAFGQLTAKAAMNKLPVPTPATSGEEMYAWYCAECHGRDGSGFIKARQSAPNLTTLAKKNNGRFPNALVRDAIRGEYHGAAYGPGEMPPWGVLFQYVGGGSKGEIEVRINKLTDFLKTLQQK